MIMDFLKANHNWESRKEQNEESRKRSLSKLKFMLIN